MICTTDSLAALAAQFPAAARVFRRHRLDYYCHGDRALRTACQAEHLDPEAVAAEIERESRGCAPAEAWDALPIDVLVHRILDLYHEPLHPEVVRLQELARRVECLHAGHPACPRGLVAHLEGLGYALEEHFAKEEEILFPLLVRGQFERAAPAIRAMVAEHEQHAAALRRTRVLAREFREPDAGSAVWSDLNRGLEQFERDLMDHMHLENHVLFPRVLAVARR